MKIISAKANACERNNYRVISALIVALLFSGCSTSKTGVFFNSFSPAVRKKSMVYSDGEPGMFFKKKQKGREKPAILFVIGGSGHPSMAYGLAYYSHALKQLHADIYALQKRHVKHRETGLRRAGNSFVRSYYFTQMVADQKEFIKMILTREENENRKVILLGVSEGVTIAAKIASELSKINYLAVIGGGGMTQAQEFKVMYPEQAEAFEAFYDSVRAHSESFDSGAIGYTYKYWSDILFREPAGYFLQLNIPILLANGSSDKSSPVASARYLDSVFHACHKTNLTYFECRGCSHTLTDEKGKSHLPDFFSSIDSLLTKSGVNVR